MTDLEERESRFERITAGNRPEKLLKTGTIPEQCAYRLQDSIFSYLKQCVEATDVKTLHDLGNMLDDGLYCDNMTPNGLLVPKSYNMMEYNRVVSCVSKLIKACNIDTFMNHTTVIPNIRFKNSLRINDGTKHATEYPHSDCWSGVPSTNATIHIPVMGDIEKNNLSFFYPGQEFEHNWLRPLESYEEGQKYVYKSTKLDIKYTDREWVLFDSAIFHQTTRQELCGWRISMDMQCIPHGELSVVYGDTGRNENMVTIDIFSEIGERQLLVFDDGYGVRRTNTFTHSANVRLVKL